MTPEQIFLRYAFPCIDERETMRVISNKHAEELKNWAMNGGHPTRRRLKFCFPHAFKALRKLSLKNGHEIWSLDNVRSYWQNHHGHQGDCAVNLLTVNSVQGKAIKAEGSDIYLNIYNLPIMSADQIWTHKRCVIELHKT